MTQTPPLPTDPVGRTLVAAAYAVALAGGVLLLAIMAMTMVSIVARALVGRPIPGDYELVEFGCAVAVFAFLPYCHVSRGNVLVEFATAAMPAHVRALLDGTIDLAFGAIAALLTWRLALGGIELRGYHEETMVLRLPVWWAFVPIVVSAGLLTAVCLWSGWQTLRGAGSRDRNQ